MSPYENLINSGLEKAREALTGRRRVAPRATQETGAETARPASSSSSFRGLNQAPPQRPLDTLLNQASSRMHTAASSFSPKSEAALEDAFRQSFTLSPFQKALSDLSPSLSAQKIGELARGIYSAVEATGNLQEAEKGQLVTRLQNAVEDSFAVTRQTLERRPGTSPDAFQQLDRTHALTRQALSHFQADVLSGAYVSKKQSTVSPEFSVAFARSRPVTPQQQPPPPPIEQQASSIKNSVLSNSSQFAANSTEATRNATNGTKSDWTDGPAKTTSELWFRGQRRVAYHNALFLK